MPHFKHITILLLALLLLACPQLSGSDDKAEKKKEENDLIRENLFGKVKMIKVETLGPGEEQSERALCSKQTFNKTGNLVELIFGEDEYLKILFKYENNLLISEAYIKDNKYSEENTYKYDHDKRGNKIRETVVDQDGKAFRLTEFTYDRKNNLVKSFQSSPSNDDKEKVAITYKYNKNGTVASESTKWSGGEGELIEYHYSNSTTLISTDRLTIDGYGVRNYYNGKGWIVKTERLDKARNVAKTKIMEYKVDKKGNWVEQHSYKIELIGNKLTKKPVKITYRTIKYFDEKK